VVPTMMGASGLSLRSPVRMPTLSGPKICENSISFELVRALSGEAYHALPPFSKVRRMVWTAIQVLPAPVGAVTRQSDAVMAATASVWKRSGVKGRSLGTPIPENTFLSCGSAPGDKCTRRPGCLPLGFRRGGYRRRPRGAPLAGGLIVAALQLLYDIGHDLLGRGGGIIGSRTGQIGFNECVIVGHEPQKFKIVQMRP
jgi:hypothetical protein